MKPTVEVQVQALLSSSALFVMTVQCFHGEKVLM